MEIGGPFLKLAVEGGFDECACAALGPLTEGSAVVVMSVRQLVLMLAICWGLVCAKSIGRNFRECARSSEFEAILLVT